MDEGHRVRYAFGAERERDQPVDSHGDAGAIRQPARERVEESFVERRHMAPEAPPSVDLVLEPSPLLRGVGELVESVRELDAACEHLEAGRYRRCPGLEPRERSLA